MDKYPLLNLPSFSPRIRTSESGIMEIFDPQRRRYVRLTPEEWVRQHFVRYLISPFFGYPQGCIGNEISIRVGNAEKRCDSVIFSTTGEPLAIAEYKAPTVQLNQKVFDQIIRYNFALQVEYLFVSNGLHHYCCHLNREKMQFEFLPQIPRYEVLDNTRR